MKIQEKIDTNNILETSNSENVVNNDLNSINQDNNSLILNLFRGFRFLNYLNPFSMI